MGWVWVPSTFPKPCVTFYCGFLIAIEGWLYRRDKVNPIDGGCYVVVINNAHKKVIHTSKVQGNTWGLPSFWMLYAYIDTANA